MGIESRYYVTSPIYYVNDRPHIGHTYTNLSCDVIARFMRLMNKEVYFLTGTDEHGQKVEIAAKERNIETQLFVDEVSKKFVELSQKMNYTNNDFIRTTEQRHIKAVQHLWQEIADKGYIYLGSYAGWYSVRDETFYNEDELVDGKAPTGAEVKWVEEPSYFFALSKFQDKLLKLYEEDESFIFPPSRRKEVIKFVEGGLYDLSISRTSFKWGIQVPGDAKHVIYVWLDALTNYISALGYPDKDAENFRKFWPVDAHVIGKDILRFHAVYWPAFLMAADIPLPQRIISHGWWTNEGQKISKSLGNVIDPLALIEEFGVDQLRYFLMRELTFGGDGNFSRASFIRRINSDLSNNIGNLVQRTLSMIVKQCHGIIPDVSAPHYNYDPLLDKIYGSVLEIAKYIVEYNFSKALDIIIQLADSTNIYIEEHAPWNLKNTNPEKMRSVLYVLAETIRCLGIMLLPFIPESAKHILDQIGIPENERNFTTLSFYNRLAAGTSISNPQVIFPRYEE